MAGKSALEEIDQRLGSSLHTLILRRLTFRGASRRLRFSSSSVDMGASPKLQYDLA